MDSFYEYLKSIGIKSESDIFNVFKKLKDTEIIDIALNCYKLTETRPNLNNGSFFNFTASTSISGGVFPCSAIDCRLRNVYELSVFAALYADKILIPNYFEYMHNFSGNFKSKEHFIKFINILIGDLILMLNLKPLINEGIVCINPRTRYYCDNCLKEQLTQEKDIDKIFKKIENKVSSNVIKNVTFTLDFSGTIITSGGKDYLSTETLKFIKLPQSLKKYIKKSPHTFSAREVKNLKLYEPFVNPALDDLIFQKYLMLKHDVVYLTNRRFEADLINILETDTEKETLGKVILEGLSHELPFVRNADISKLLKIRKNENSAFISYRDALKNTLIEVSSEKNVRKIKKIMRDNVIPEVNKIDRIIKTHKDDLGIKIKGKVLFNGMIITSGLFAKTFFGLDIPNIITVALGGIFTVKDIFPDLLSSLTIPIEAKRNNFYFLWKLK